MADFISREALLEDIDEAVKHRGMGEIIGQTLRRYILRQPAADGVEVTRCGNCKYKRDTLYCRLRETPVIVSNADFCSFGKRRDK